MKEMENVTIERLMEAQKEMDNYWKLHDIKENIEICDDFIKKYQAKMSDWKKNKEGFETRLLELENKKINNR